MKPKWQVQLTLPEKDQPYTQDVVVDTAHHDRFHRLHPDPNDPNEETS